jgi:hypothetical protein
MAESPFPKRQPTGSQLGVPPVKTVGAAPPVDPGGVAYPQSHATTSDILTELAGVAASHAACTSFYLDTTEGMSRGISESGISEIVSGEGEDHHQGLARSHLLSDGSIYWFLSHSEVGQGEQGSLTQYRYDGPRDADHVLQTSPLTVAPMATEPLMLDERHPSDIAFLPDVNGADAGYLLVTEEDDRHVLAVYRWAPGQQLTVRGQIPPPPQAFPAQGPNFVFIDRIDDRYCLGVASNNWGNGYLYWADQDKLFPASAPGALDVTAFELDPVGTPFVFPVADGPCQTKLIRDSTGWSLLAFRGDPNDDENADDYVDVYPVTFAPSFTIGNRIASVHISFNAGDTGFASTGTHHVEAPGRLLISSSYRWAQDEGPGGSSYVSRVDECPSSTPPTGPAPPGGGPIDIGRPPHRPD